MRVGNRSGCRSTSLRGSWRAVGRETIHQTPLVQGRRELPRWLRTGRAARRPRDRWEDSGRISDMAMVSDHPVEAATGVEPQRAASVVAIRRVGDWHHGPVSDDRSRWHGSNDRAEDEQGTELERLQPFLELAREISREVARLAADDSADVESLAETIDLIPRRERQRLTLGVFDRLPSEVQWSI